GRRSRTFSEKMQRGVSSCNACCPVSGRRSNARNLARQRLFLTVQAIGSIVLRGIPHRRNRLESCVAFDTLEPDNDGHTASQALSLRNLRSRLDHRRTSPEGRACEAALAALPGAFHVAGAPR